MANRPSPSLSIESLRYNGSRFGNPVNFQICLDHDERINYIDTVFVYHFGTRFLVEVHVVMDPNMILRETHDIAEALQNNIESLPNIERAFVHIDYDFDHKPSDEHKDPTTG